MAGASLEGLLAGSRGRYPSAWEEESLGVWGVELGRRVEVSRRMREVEPEVLASANDEVVRRLGASASAEELAQLNRLAAARGVEVWRQWATAVREGSSEGVRERWLRSALMRASDEPGGAYGLETHVLALLGASRGVLPGGMWGAVEEVGLELCAVCRHGGVARLLLQRRRKIGEDTMRMMLAATPELARRYGENATRQKGARDAEHVVEALAEALRQPEPRQVQREVAVYLAREVFGFTDYPEGVYRFYLHALSGAVAERTGAEGWLAVRVLDRLADAAGRLRLAAGLFGRLDGLAEEAAAQVDAQVGVQTGWTREASARASLGVCRTLLEGLVEGVAAGEGRIGSGCWSCGVGGWCRSWRRTTRGFRASVCGRWWG